MIQTGVESRVKIQQIISSQLPNFILDESPNTSEFLKQYYVSQEYQGGPTDIAENLDQYLKLDNLTPEVVVDSVNLSTGIGTDVNVGIITVTSTKGFPQKYGLLKIDDEIITYTGITTNTFTGCIRGFSGITSYHTDLNQEELVFSKSEIKEHKKDSSVQNLSSLFLKEFYKKIKSTFTPGLEEYDFVNDLNVGNFIREARSFYQAKGTDESFRILFNVLYGVTPRVVNLENFLIKPSSSEFIRREVIVVEKISGDPGKLVGQTIVKSTDKSTNAPVSEVEPFTRNNKQYHKISLFVGYDDSTAVVGNFTITPNTKCLENVSIGASIISVDSTIGFPQQGVIISGINTTITYTSKSINQFFGCSGITSSILSSANIRSDEIYFGYENGDLDKKVELRLCGVLSKFVQISDNLNLDEGEIISVKHIGSKIENPTNNKTYKEIFANSWIYNTSSRYQISDISNFTLKSRIDRSSLKIGDRVEILVRDSNIVKSSTTNIAYISNINNVNNSVTLSNLVFTPQVGVEYDLRRKINTARSSPVSIEFGDNSIISDIQNLYVDDDYAYVASNSLPSGIVGLNTVYNYEITKNIKSSNATALDNLSSEGHSTILFSSSVPFITGDRIYYQPSGTNIVGLDTGDYYVQVQNPDNGIKLYSSKSFVGTNSHLNFKSATFDSQNEHNFTLYSQKSRVIDAQKLLKKFPISEKVKTVNVGIETPELTIPGSIGMLINGVEIRNYKSDDKIYYGPLKSIEVLNGGNNYDVINLPLISVSSGVGETALVQPVISGSFKKVYIDSQDYDIKKIISIDVSGGNGSGVVLEPIVVKRQRPILFDGRPTTNSGGISSTTSQLTFLTNHNLNNQESIIYNSNGNTPIGIGASNLTLINNATYYVKIDNNRTVRLFSSILECSSGINTISFNSNNTSGIHKFSTAAFKNTVSEIKILNPGSGYTNRKLIVSPTGISTINHTINFENHGFSSGELVNYKFETSTIGISTASQYYVLKDTNNSFRLCDAGISGNDISNYSRQNYVKFTGIGSGYQYFSYPDISVSILYSPVGVGTTTQTYSSLIVTPVVTGSIISTYLYKSGTGYGSAILNLEKSPIITIKNGKEARIQPVIVNGQITDVNIQYGGVEYYSVPNLSVKDLSGAGTGAELRPIISNGKIIDVKVVNIGIGYSSTSTIINVQPTGSNAKFNANIRSLSVNHNFKFGDEILVETDNKLQYSVCGYFKELRESFNDTGEVSNIIGWAYDGNPIYGPYGYSDPENSSSIPKILTPGYILNTPNVVDRPQFPAGFFVEDYQYNNSGDLDENNGRFGKTPEFPNGVYAYFTTISSGTLIPQFPYFIGNKYRSKTLNENETLNQSYNFNDSNLSRNTLPYKISDNYAGNDFIIESGDRSNQQSIVESVSEGSISGFNIINSGTNYKIDDVLNFDDANTSGGGIIARVSSIGGKDIVEINTSIQTYQNSIFTWKNSNEVKVNILPYHNLSNNDYVVISGLSTSLSKLNKPYKIGVSSYYSNVAQDIPSSTVGVVTEIYISQFPETVSIGSSITIGSETLSILEVFKNLNILKVERGSTGVSHTATTQINFISDSFTISQNIDYFESDVNDKVYFNPTKSVGVGTISGITNSIVVSFGSSTITRVIPTQGIYIENHPFTHNQSVIFKIPPTVSLPGGEIAISTSPTSSTFNIPTNSPVYVSNKNKNVIGIKTNLNSSEVYFRTVNQNDANNEKYSFESLYPQIIGKVEKISSTVSVSTSHQLSNEDTIDLEVKPNLSVGIGTSSFVNVKRDLLTGNILINPIGFNSTGINTTTNTITINSHNLKTGDKVLYSANLVASGLTTDFYYVSRVDDNNIKLSKTLIDNKTTPPTVVSIASTGGSSQSISLVNPQIKSVKNNNLVFNLSDSSLIGYKFRLYYDQSYNKEFVSTTKTSGFTISGIGTVGVSSTASLTINYDESLPDKIYYNLEKSGYISTSDKTVTNYSEILFTNSTYTSKNYRVSGIGSTTFNITLTEKPEKLKYSQNECSTLKYNTKSLTARGPIDKINIVSGGYGYRKIPIFVGSNSIDGKDAFIVAISTSIGNAREVRILDEGFEYSSDKTLQPISYISPVISIKNSNTIGVVTVTSGGSQYINSPLIVIVDSSTGQKINSGILEAKLSGSSISSVNIVQKPKGLPETSVKLFTTINTNGISVQRVQSNSSGIFTCFITTPTLGFSTNPFKSGDEVFIEGIQKLSTSGSGFNSEDYGYKFLPVSNYNNTTNLHQVTINVSGLTTNTGIAKTIQDSIPNIINKKDYPTFDVKQISSLFYIGENLVVNGNEVDLKISDCNSFFIKVIGDYELVTGDVITGKESGNIATVTKIDAGVGKFKVDYSVRKTLGWSDNVGRLDYDDQVVQDNDYYQNLSYTIKSPITYNELRTPVNSLVHTSGLKNFSDTGITSTARSEIITSNNSTTIIRDIVEENRVDTIYDFDLVQDVDVVTVNTGITSTVFSKLLKLKNKKLTDYIECRSNVVLKIDNINKQFSNLDGSPSQFLNLIELNSGTSYDNILVRVSSADNSQIQLSELILLNDGNNAFLAEKSKIVSAGERDVNLLSTTINSTVGIGSTVIFVADTTGLIVGVSSISVVGAAITNRPIVAVGTTFVQIGVASTSPSIISIGTTVNFSTIDFDAPLKHRSKDDFGTFSLIDNYLRFEPNDPFNIDYDVKLIKSRFNTILPGIGTNPIGFINLTGSNKLVGSGITTSILSVQSNQFSSLYTNVQIIDTTTNKMNFVEVYLKYDGADTYISEYYFDSEFSTNFYSGNFIGTFGASISSGILSLNYTNNSLNTVNTRSKVVGFGTTSVGGGTHRFLLTGQLSGFERGALYQSIHTSTVSAASTSIISLNKFNFNAIKSLVEVSVGSTSALHQIMLVQDLSDIYVQQSPFLSANSATGIGTFGGEYSGDDFVLKFYPDASITSQIKISSFNQCLYTILDSQNIAPDLTYGSVTESIDLQFYNAINGNRINRKDFKLTSNGIPIFTKTFDPSNSNILNPSTGVFTIPNHFFSPKERLIYTPKSTFIGIGESAVGIGATLNSVGVVTTILPSDVYVIKLSDDSFKLSTRPDYAQLGIGVTFTSYGLGNAHQLEMFKRNEKGLITIDNLAQYPLIFSKISYTLSGNGGQISAGSTIFSLSGISTISPKNILKVDDEYMGIVNVGLGTTNIGPITNSGVINLVQVTRGFVGSSATSHTDSTEARIYKGSYNIVKDNIFFTESPRGNPQLDKDLSNLDFETSDFTGRVYLRNDYTSNQIYDDISDQFTGIGRTFTLRVGGANTVGLGTTGGNGILFINSVFQTPETLNNPKNNFKIIENSSVGISSVVFSGIRDAVTDDIIISPSDINQNQTPRGGIIISLGSSTGLGYAPLVGAAVTAVVGAGGSIVSVGLGTTDNLGSGYNGIVAIGVSVYQSGHIGDTAIITASVGVGGTLSFTVGAGGTGYTNPKVFVSEPSYENLTVTGVSRLGIGATTDTGIGLLLNVEVGASSTTGIGSTYFEVSKFSISRQGYAFQRGDVFKPVGLVTAKGLASPLSEFNLTVLSTFTDSFALWQFGELDYIDSVKNYQDGIRTRFPLFYNDQLLSFEQLQGSQVNLSNALLIVINGVVQDPGVAYEFEGGTSFVFTTAPKSEDDIAIFFYKGTTGDDTRLFTGIPETLKRGDQVQVLKNNSISGTVTQDKRVIFDLSFSDKFETNLYADQGIDITNDKPLSWIKQKSDKLVNGQIVYKTRDSIEPLVYPTAKIIKDFSTTDGEIFVDNAQFFDYENPTDFGAIIINGSADPVAAGITAVVSAAGTIQSLVINNSGSGYTGNSVVVKISSPPKILEEIGDVIVAVGSTATATVTVGAGGTLTTPITITNPGFGYTNSYTNFVGIVKNIIGAVGITTTIITGITTTGIVIGQTLQKVDNIIGSGTTVTSIGIEEIFINPKTLNSTNNSTILSFGSYITTTSLSQPKVIAPLPDPIYENITSESPVVNGFSGIITGIGTTTGIGGNPLALKFHLNSTKFAEQNQGGISTGYPIYIFDTRVGNGVTSIDSSDSSKVGIGTTFVDNIYYISSWSYSGIVGIITCNILSTTSVVGLNSTGDISNPVGRYSWGRLFGFSRSSSPISIGVTGNTVDVGLSTFPTIQRRDSGIRRTGALPKLL
jgi:hypothetical protein